MPCICFYDLLVIIIKLDSNEIRKLPVKFPPFKNLKDIILNYILFKTILLGRSFLYTFNVENLQTLINILRKLLYKTTIGIHRGAIL